VIRAISRKHTLIDLQTGCDCELSAWEERSSPRAVETAPAKTVSVLVDTKGTGAFRIYKLQGQTSKFVGGVGIDTGLTIIRWDPEWIFFCTGQLRFRYLKEKE